MKILLCLISVLAIMTVSQAHAASVQETIDLLKSNQAILVDTRNPKSYINAWIPGSVNIPLADIKTKKWLQGKKVILVNEGFATLELQRTALALNKEGFEVDILDGGLVAWQQKDQKIVGDIFAIKDLNKVKASEAVTEKDNPSYLFIDVTSSQKSPVKNTFPTAQHLKKSSDLAKIIKTQQSKDPLSTTVALFITDGPPSQKLIAEYSKASSIPFFYIQDGMAGITSFYNSQQALHKPLAQRIKTVGGCPTCPTPDETK